MEKPTKKDQDRCIEIRKQSKQGCRLSREDQHFTDRMFRLYPEWYKSLNRQIFEDTAPFGSKQLDE